MRIDLHGLTFETPRVTFYLWWPWRATALEHRLFDAVCEALGIMPQVSPQGVCLQISDPRNWRSAVQAVARVLKGWQEEADPAGERRSWRWLLEGESDPYGYDSAGEPASLWGLVQITVDYNSPGETSDGEDMELESFNFRIWPQSR
jgi:hypothetical protein